MASRSIFRVFPSSIVALAVAAGSGLWSSCGGSSGDGAPPIPCNDHSCRAFDGAPADVFFYDGGIEDVSADAEPSGLNPLCGAILACNPDDPSVCAEYAQSGLLDGAALEDAKADATEGAKDASTADSASLTDASGIAKDSGRDSGVARFACTVSYEQDLLRAACQAAGTGGIDAPCLTTRDCAPGLACTGDEYAAQCRPYCCAGNVACSKGSYCAERPLRIAQAGKTLSVPVCVVADQCDLSQPYPCPASLQSKGLCTCKDPETACAVVRGDGTTSCIKPGTGKVGEDCPCAWDHICSQATGKCLKLCSTTSLADACSGGKCQASANLPEDFGVCVGEVRSDE